MSEWMSHTVVNIMNTLGYGGIALLMFLENLFPPIPSELIMPLAGFTVAQGNLDFTLAVIAGVVGTMVGALPWYYLGRLVGEDRLRRLANRYGRWLALSGDDIDKANGWFSRHGGLAVLLCRLVPGVRTLISLPAGINAMPLLPFLVYSTIGTTAWIIILTSLGYFLGEHYDRVDQYLGPWSKIILLSLATIFGIWVFRRLQTQKTAQKVSRQISRK
jgi:membrane protein DedA with SNARE-associated domain